jgi:hypothetical protein
MNQTAQYLASKGRNGDTMLVHMSPQEVGGLQTLARNNGTTLTVNPQTGLPEAFNLGRLLPMVAGAGLTMLSGGTLSPLTIGLMTGGLGAVATGSLKEGLMMGLGAAGGAGLAGSMANLAAPAATSAAPAAGSGLTVPTALPPPTPVAAPLNFSQPLAPQVAANTAFPPTDLSLTSGMNLPPAGGGLQTLKAPVSLAEAPPPLDFSQGAPSLSSQIATRTAPLEYTASLPAQPPAGSLIGPPKVSLAAPLEPPPLDFSQPLGPQMAGRYPSELNKSLIGGTPTPPPPSYGSRVLEGGKKAFGSMESAGDFLSNNKMNLAMSAAPALLADPEYAGPPESNSMMRPYSLDIDNTSDIAASPVGREDERLRYRYTAGTPYKAAQGGIIAFAEGGNTTDGQEIGSNPLSPEAARVYQSIARIQGQAGLPQIDLSTMPVVQQSPVARLNTQPAAPMYRPVDYRVPMPQYMDSETYRQIDQKRKEGPFGDFFDSFSNVSTGFAGGGQAKYRDVRKKIDRMADPYGFTGYQRGEGMYESAQRNFAGGGGLGNVPRFLSGGGDGMSDSIPATINDRQPARLADGEFVIPADVVSHLGNGSSKAGAKQLYAMMDRVRTKRTGKKKQAPAVNSKKMMPA